MNSENKVFVTGATGVIGRKMLPILVSKGYQVAGLTTSQKGADFLESINVKPYIGNIYEGTSLKKMIEEYQPDKIIHQLTDLKNMSSEANSKIRQVGTTNLVTAAQKQGVKKIISQSISWAYEAGAGLATEQTLLDKKAGLPRKLTIDGIITLEEESLKIPEHVILRYGTLYGKGTWYGKNGVIYKQFVKGRSLVSTGIQSFIHLDDAVALTVQALEWESGFYNIVDDEPVSGAVWGAFYAEKLGVTAPVVQNGAAWERGASNQKIRARGAHLNYPSWKKGLRKLD